MKRHSTDLTALLFGLAFAGAGAMFLFHQLSDRHVDAAWASAAGFAVLGIVALTATLLRLPRDESEPEPEPEEVETI